LEIALFLPLTVGLALSFAVIALLRPVLPAPWRWAWQGVTLHAGLWLMLHASLVLILGRPWFAMAIGLAFLMLLVQVSNAKFHSLREPFVFQDFEYFTDAIRHPRLYIPFLGWWKFALIVVAVSAALAIGLWLEAAPAERFSLSGQLGEVMLLLIAGSVLVIFSNDGPELVFSPDADLQRLGFLGCLWAYACAEKSPMRLPKLLPDLASLSPERPDLLVVQSESFFDPRSYFPGIRSDVLAEFDQLNLESICHGQLQVPAWGANTVRSEFAFLSGVTEEMLGVHRFNPYRQILKAEVFSVARELKAVGYRTVCIHPYSASFYGRDKVYPHLGFDEFIDDRSFVGAERFGPYISDRAVAEKAKSLIASADGPIFVFLITMENHGPLHLEKPDESDYAALYSELPPSGCEDLTVYLRHLRNADRMMGGLREFLAQRTSPTRFCWYGDHVPIMPSVYRQFGPPDGRTNYFVWENRSCKSGVRLELKLTELAGVSLGPTIPELNRRYSM
jgi:hypothetical protein